MAMLSLMLQLAFFFGPWLAKAAVLNGDSSTARSCATPGASLLHVNSKSSFLPGTLVQSRDQLPSSAQSEPLLNCHSLSISATNSWEQAYLAAAKTLCADKANWPYMEVFLDKRFAKQYSNFFGRDGWADRAWVNYAKAAGKGDYFGLLTRKLVESIHRHSAYPIVVVNFGNVAIPDLDPESFPQLVLLHARGLPEGSISFNFNKLRAVLLAHVKTGVSLDSDMMMVGPHADQLLLRTEEEVTEAYPLPMMPTHFLTRDPREAGSGLGNSMPYNCDSCPTPTMRWGQAQPSWTFWSLPFFARWLGAKLAGRSEQGVVTAQIGEDEDLLNVALWREGASKAWCMYQMGGVSFLWENYFPEHAPGPSPFYEDPRFFPQGVPIGFFFSHAEKYIEKVDKALAFLQEHRNATGPPPKAFFHMMKFYDTFAQLKAEHPHLKCIL